MDPNILIEDSVGGKHSCVSKRLPYLLCVIGEVSAGLPVTQAQTT